MQFRVLDRLPTAGRCLLIVILMLPAGVARAQGTGGADTARSAPAAGGRAYQAFEVDRPAAIVKPATPKYPSDLQRDGIAGSVQVEYVVDSTGKADMTTFKVLATRHNLFTAAVRDAVSKLRFTPAELGGRKVRQVVTQEFSFSR